MGPSKRAVTRGSKLGMDAWRENRAGRTPAGLGGRRWWKPVITVAALSLAGIAAPFIPPGGAGVVSAQVFSVDDASPLAGPADLFTPGPAVYARAEAIGLLADDEVDALSFGFDEITSATFRFSAGYFATGALIPGNAVCSEAGLCSPAAPCPPEASADLFSTAGGGAATLLFDGDGVPGPASPLGLSECPAGGPGIQDNMDAFDDLAAPLVDGRPLWPVYLSLAPGSPTLAGANPLLPGGAGPADILMYDPAHDSLSIYFAASDIGLAAGDDIDGLSFYVLSGDFLVSLAPGSPSLGNVAICPAGCTAGDFIRSAGPVCGLTPCLAGGLSFASAGLAAGDNADAADQPGGPPPFLFDDTSPGKTFSLDPSSPSLHAIRTAAPKRKGSAADLLTHHPGIPATGTPVVAYRAEALGLTPDDDIDGLSFGLEPVLAPGGEYAIEFSVDRSGTGAPGTGVFLESGAGGSEASSDLFETFLPAPPSPPIVPPNRQVWDGNGSSAPTLQLREVSSPNLAIGDDLDALEGPPRIVDEDGDGVRDRRVFFSLAPGSPTLAAIGATPADVLVCVPPSNGACGASTLPGIFLAHGDLGLAPTDNLEDFNLDAATGDIDFTLSPGAGFPPGAILKRPGFGGCGGPAPCPAVAPGDAGLLVTDNMNALDSLHPLQICVTITPGDEPGIEVTPGVCPACPACPPPLVPYDVIEGELGELGVKPQGVDLSRVFCRADGLAADRITLSGGVDPFTRPRFILVRNDGAADYGPSSDGNPRNASSGDCP